MSFSATATPRRTLERNTGARSFQRSSSLSEADVLLLTVEARVFIFENLGNFFEVFFFVQFCVVLTGFGILWQLDSVCWIFSVGFFEFIWTFKSAMEGCCRWKVSVALLFYSGEFSIVFAVVKEKRLEQLRRNGLVNFETTGKVVSKFFLYWTRLLLLFANFWAFTQKVYIIAAFNSIVIVHFLQSQLIIETWNVIVKLPR